MEALSDPQIRDIPPDGVDASDLTPPSLVEIDYIAPPAALSDYVTTLYYVRCDEHTVKDIQPASVGWVSILARGEGAMEFQDGRTTRFNPSNIITPFSFARPISMTGPVRTFGAALSPLGWAALTGLNAAEHGNKMVRAGDLLGPGIELLGAELIEAYRSGRKTGQECARAVGEYILSNIKPVNVRHAALIETTNRWLGSSLNPSLEDLLTSANYSERQVQRLVERYFGLPPTALARKYRALRAAALLSFPRLTPEYEAELGDAFYDQSHMIRELRLFVGRTPARLSDDDSPFLNEMIDPKNFRELAPRRREGAA